MSIILFFSLSRLLNWVVDGFGDFLNRAGRACGGKGTMGGMLPPAFFLILFYLATWVPYADSILYAAFAWGSEKPQCSEIFQ